MSISFDVYQTIRDVIKHKGQPMWSFPPLFSYLTLDYKQTIHLNHFNKLMIHQTVFPPHLLPKWVSLFESSVGHLFPRGCFQCGCLFPVVCFAEVLVSVLYTDNNDRVGGPRTNKELDPAGDLTVTFISKSWNPESRSDRNYARIMLFSTHFFF